MLRFAGLFVLLMIPACSSEDSAPGASLQQLLPAGKIDAERLQLRAPLPIAAIGFVMQQAIKENNDWMAQYARENDGPGALPYHENFGVSEEEYDRYIASMEAGEAALRSDAEVSFEVVNFGASSKLKASELLATVNNLEFDWAHDTVHTPWGDLVGSEEMKLDSEKAALSPFVGRRWEMLSGDPEAVLTSESGSAKMLKVYLGTRNDNQDVLLYFRAMSVQQGIVYVNDEVILQWPMR
jgi:hypothetical protein